jgi:hypothetical protein
MQNFQSNMARNYVNMFTDSIPENAVSKFGLGNAEQGTGINPLTEVTDPRQLEIARSAAEYFFAPQRRRSYQESLVPTRVEEFQGLSDIDEAEANMNVLDSSMLNQRRNLVRQASQQTAERATDQINDQYANAIIDEITKRLMDNLQLAQSVNQGVVNSYLPMQN